MFGEASRFPTVEPQKPAVVNLVLKRMRQKRQFAPAFGGVRLLCFVKTEGPVP